VAVAAVTVVDSVGHGAPAAVVIVTWVDWPATKPPVGTPLKAGVLDTTVVVPALKLKELNR